MQILSAFCLLAVPVLLAQEPTLSCATCHPAQARTQPATSMAHALQIADSDPLFTSHSELTFTRGAYAYRIARENGRIVYSVTDGRNRLALPVKWAFGVGAQTFVLEKDGHLYESLVSYYPAVDALDLTMGDQDIEPTDLMTAMGRDLPADQSVACFGCHTTGGVSERKLSLGSVSPGVQCSRCHVGVEKHQAAISHGSLAFVPTKLGKLSAEDMSSFCGQCHRTWQTVVLNRWHGEINVRFQPYRLADSKCFDGVDARIRCTACHDPHQEVIRSETTYDAKCLACHSAGAKPSAGMIALAAAGKAPSAQMKSCPVGKEKCVGCHMPKVQLPGSHMTFSDHMIRIVRSGEAYPD